MSVLYAAGALAAILSFGGKFEASALQGPIPLEHSDQTQLYKDLCPKFSCNDKEEERKSFSRYLSDQVYCFKSDFADPLSVYLKDCEQFAKEAGKQYDVFGQPFRKDSDRKLFCHGQLNRCMADPYVKFSERLLGSKCNASYQCLSGYCSAEGLCEREPNSDWTSGEADLSCWAH